MFRCQETPRQKQETLKRLPLSSSPETLGCSPRGTGGGGCWEEDAHHPDKNVCRCDPDLDKLVKTEQDGCFIRAWITRRRVPSGGRKSRLYITEVMKWFKNIPHVSQDTEDKRKLPDGGTSLLTLGGTSISETKKEILDGHKRGQPF